MVKSESFIEFEREADGRWIAEVLSIPGCMAYGDTQEQALERVMSLYCAVSERAGYWPPKAKEGK